MTTEEDLLQEHYMDGRQSRQLFLGYSGTHQRDNRGKVTKAISVGLFSPSCQRLASFSGRTSVGVSGVGSDD
jgi:hypothetical protein